MPKSATTPGDQINYRTDIWKDGQIIGEKVLPATVINIDNRRKQSVYIKSEGFIGWIYSNQIV